MNKRSGLLLGLILWSTGLFSVESKVVYHGSPYDFEKVEPRYSIRIDASEKVVWQGAAIFGSVDYRIALFYTHNRVPGFTAVIDLIHPTLPDAPVTFSLQGGRSVEEALDVLYGTPSNDQGFIYELKAEKFRTEKGLGAMECISYDSSANRGKKSIHRRQEIDRLIEQGLILIEWRSS